jgi:MraZ protein
MAEFTGIHVHTLDDKGRVSVPAQFRRQLTGENLYLNVGLDGCLVLYPPEKWARVRNELGRLSKSSSRQRHVLRKTAMHLKPVCVDSQGRISIPSELISLAGIENEVIFLGQFDAIEIWSPEGFEAYLSDERFSYEEVVEDLEIDF